MVILTQLDKRDFEKIAEQFKLGHYRSSKHNSNALSNTVYELKTTNGKYILKIFEDVREDWVKFQAHIIHVLTDAKVATPPLIKSINGRDYIKYHRKPLLVQEFFKGRRPKKFTNSQVYDFGITLARMHQTLAKIKGGNYWRNNSQFIMKKIVYEINDLKLNNEFKKIVFQIRRLKVNKLKKGIIHSDLHDDNLLMNNKTTFIIDWDDVHRDFYAYELAVFIGTVLVKRKRVYRNQIRLFLKGYETITQLTDEEKRAIYYFIGHRLLLAIDWGMRQLKKHPDLKKNIQSWLFEFIEKYRNFYKITPEVFNGIVP